jgi:hypothetical protein
MGLRVPERFFDLHSLGVQLLDLSASCRVYEAETPRAAMVPCAVGDRSVRGNTWRARRGVADLERACGL